MNTQSPTSPQVKAVAFDFDGVFVLDSDAVFKKEAWKVALSRYTGQYEALLQEAKTMFGFGKKGGRTETLRYIFERLGVPKENIADLVEEAARVFDVHVQTRILEAGLIPGAREMLQELHGRGLPLYLNSGTATSALVLSAQNLNIASFFRKILGSTPEPIGGSKTDNLTYIAAQERISPSEIIFFGDGDSDEKAAYEFGCRFIGFANRWNNWKAQEKQFPVVDDLRDLSNYLS